MKLKKRYVFPKLEEAKQKFESGEMNERDYGNLITEYYHKYRNITEEYYEGATMADLEEKMRTYNPLYQLCDAHNEWKRNVDLLDEAKRIANGIGSEGLEYYNSVIREGNKRAQL